VAGGAATEGGAEGEPVALAEPAGLAAVEGELDAEAGLVASAWVSVATGLLTGGGVAACELLLHAVALRARAVMHTVAARVFRRMAAPTAGTGRSAPILEANPSPVTAR
jgi:hypothetical protein